MTVSALYNCLSILLALLDHDVNILFSSIKTIKWMLQFSLKNFKTTFYYGTNYAL